MSGLSRRQRRRPLGALTLAAMLSIGCAGLATAQRTTLVAGVAEQGSGAPLVDAEVIVVDLHLIARTNWIGEAVITDIPAGTHRVRVRKVGYAAADIELPFRRDTVGPVFMLTRQPISLDTVRVTAEHVPLRLEAFENRKKMGLGRFVTDSVLSRYPDASFAQIAATHFPGLIVMTNNEGIPYLVSMRHCVPRVLLDDMPLHVESFDLIRAWDLAGMEYYSGETMPVQYRRPGSACGLLLLWSK